jgi:flavin-dependent dehydrogenase
MPSLVVAARRDLDGALLDSAVEAGATHVPLRAVDIVSEPPGWRIETRSGAIHCRWLLGADGPGSLVRRRVFRPFARADLSIASGYFVQATGAPTVTIAFEHAPAGYLWSFPRPDHLAVGVCAQADESTSSALESAARAWIGRKFGPTVPLERYSWPIPSLSAAAIDREVPAGRGWLLLGDAAGLVDPITGEGLYYAIRSADLAARAILEEVGITERIAAYRRMLRRDFAADLEFGSRLAKRVFQGRFLFGAVPARMVQFTRRSPRFSALMRDLFSGKQPYIGLKQRLLRNLNGSLYDIMMSLGFSRLVPRKAGGESF